MRDPQERESKQNSPMKLVQSRRERGRAFETKGIPDIPNLP